MQCVILAGGLGTRMWPEAKTVPKTLLPVADEPFAFWQLTWLADAGIDSVVYSIGYLGWMISDYVGDGARWGLTVNYVDEGDHLRGTAGALRLAYETGVLENTFLVLYGDSWLQVNPADVLQTAKRATEPALMTVMRNDNKWDGSNVVLEGSQVTRYAKGLVPPPPEMRWIDYGLLAFESGLIQATVPVGQSYDLATLCADLAAEGRLAGYEVTERFYEIGSPSGRDELSALLADRHS